MIHEVTVRGFRGVPEELRLLFAPLTLLAGRNGLGKTTIFDAIDWCLFGDAWRLGGDGAAVRNLYRDEARPYVAVVLTLSGRVRRVERTEAGAQLDGSAVADRDLILEFVTDAEMFPPYLRDLAERVRRLVYLPQETIRELLIPEGNRAREGLFSVLLGVPNAALVRSSFRRIKERLDERHGADSIQCATYANDIEELRRQVGVEQARIAADRAEVIGEARRVLGSETFDLVSPEALLERARSILETLDRERRRLEEVVLFVARFEARRALMEKELEHRGDEVKASRYELGELERAVEKATDASQAIRERASAAAVAVADAERTRSASARRLRLTREAADVRVVMMETGTRLSALEESVGMTRAAVGRLSDQAIRQRVAVDEQQDVVDALRREYETALSMEALREQHRSGAARLFSLNMELASARAEANRQEGGLIEARSLLARTEEELANLLHRMSSYDRLRVLRTELTSLAEGLGLSRCPLCGAPYRDNRELLEHCRGVDEMGTSESDPREQLHEVIARSRNDVVEMESQLRILRSEMARMEEEQRAAVLQLATIDTRVGREIPSVPRTSEEIIGALRQAEEALASAATAAEVAEAELRATASDMAEAQRATDSVERELGELRTRLRGLEDELDGETLEPATEESRLREADQRRAEALRKHQALEEQSRVALAQERERRSDRDRAVLKLSDALGRQAAAGRVLETARSEMRAKLDEVGLAPEPSGAHSALERMMRRYVEIERLVSSLTELVAMERQHELSRELDALQARMKNAVDALSGLERARERIRTIEISVESRLESEEATGMGRLQNGIQECLRAIYPHRHLDVVELSALEGKILVSDDGVGRGVEPSVFTSTGQQNALVLAVFIAAALRQRVTSLPFILLDEPVQNLDDVHFLGFLGLIKRIVLSRQLILSTADRNVAEVMRRQMKGLIDKGKYAHYEWREFTSQSGPEVISVEQPPSSRV